MTSMADDAQQRIDAYLAKLRGQLRGFDDTEVRELVDELRSHIADKLALSEPTTGAANVAAVDAALAALGTAEELASQYVTDNLLARAEVSRSPLQILKSLFRWASLSIAGFCVLLGSLIGYLAGIVFLLCALLKPFHPHTAGLWIIPDGAVDVEISLRLGFGSIPAGREVLGWWIVPLGLVAGFGLVMLTTRYAVWCARRYRRPSVLPRG
jgi:uncharacterized membrane protein